MAQRNPDRSALISLRTAVVLGFGVLTGIGAGALTELAHAGVAQALTASAVGVSGGVLFFNKIIN